MLRTILYEPDTGQVHTGAADLVPAWLENKKQLIWVDFENHDKQEEREFLAKYFDLNNLAIDDAQRDRHPPKLEWFSNYYFLLIKAFNAQTDSINFGILHISFFVGENFIITRHDGVSPSINKVRDMVLGKDIDCGKGASYICYRIIRTIVDRYTPVILSLETRLEKLEDIMLDKPSDKLLSELIHYNSSLKKLRRIFNYQEGIFSQMSGTGSRLLESTRHEFQDIHEQMERLSSLSDLFQGLARDLIDGYISVTSHRLNQIMKVLTIVAVIFLPLTFIAGIYGMNFENMPELRQENAYYIILGFMCGLAIAMILLFRKLKWL